MAHVISQIDAVQAPAIDREKVCPLLLRIFCASGRHNPITDYARGSTPMNELQIYTWMDCTLRELVALIKDVNVDSRKKGTEFKFSVVAPHPRNPRFVMNDVGVLINGSRGLEDTKTLATCKFEVGDYIDVAIIPPSPGGGFRNGAERRSTGFADRERRRFVPY